MNDEKGAGLRAFTSCLLPSLKNMTVVKRGKQWCLISKTSGRTLGCHPSRKEALGQETAIQISKARAAGHIIPKKA